MEGGGSAGPRLPSLFPPVPGLLDADKRLCLAMPKEWFSSLTGTTGLPDVGLRGVMSVDNELHCLVPIPGLRACPRVDLAI